MSWLKVFGYIFAYWTLGIYLIYLLNLFRRFNAHWSIITEADIATDFVLLFILCIIGFIAGIFLLCGMMLHNSDIFMCGILLSLVSPVMMILATLLKSKDSFNVMYAIHIFLAEIFFLLPITCSYYFSELKEKK